MITTRRCHNPRLALILSAVLIFLPFTTAMGHPRGEDTLLKGAVRSARTGQAMSDVIVRVVSMATAESVAEAVTSGTGNVEFSGLPYGLYMVAANPPLGYLAVPGPLVYLGPERHDVSVSLVLEPLAAGQQEGEEDDDCGEEAEGGEQQEGEEDDDDDCGGGFPLIPILLGVGTGVAVGALTLGTVVENRTQ